MDFAVSFQTACLFFFFVQGLLFAGMLVAKSRQYEHRLTKT